MTCAKRTRPPRGRYSNAKTTCIDGNARRGPRITENAQPFASVRYPRANRLLHSPAFWWSQPCDSSVESRGMPRGNISLFCALALFGVLFQGRVHSAQLIDDRVITVHSAREIAARRRALIQYLWGREGFPDRRLPNVLTNVASPVKQLSHLSRV